MRKLMWFTIGFGAACAFGAYFWVGKWMIAALILGFAGLAFLPGREKRKKRLGFICLGILLGTGWFYAYDWFYTAPLRQLDGKTVDVVLTTVSESWETDYGCAVDCRLTLEEKHYRIRLYLNEKQTLHPWTSVYCPVEFRLTTDGGAREPTFHRSQGILALGYQRDEGNTVLREDRGAGFWVILRCQICDWIDSAIDECFSEGNAAFARALLLGDQSDISYEMSTDFRVSGISHIVAVSGLHMSIVFGLVAFVTWKRRWMLVTFGIPAVFLFMLVAGFRPSVTRAGIMMILLVLSLVFKREYDPPTALSFAAVSMLAVNPLVASSVAFQLSVGSVAGIFLFMGKISGWILEWIPKTDRKILKFLRNWLAVSIGVTLSAQVVTVPLVAVYFHTVSLVSVLTNLLVVWAVTFIFYGVMLVCVVWHLWAPGAVLLGKLVSLPIGYVCLTAKLLSKLPFAAVYTENIYVVVWLCFVYGLTFLGMFGREKRIALSTGLAAAGLAAAILLGWLEPRLWDQSVTVLDVGQGQSVILQHRDKTFLVDCGGDFDDNAANLAAQTLLGMGIRRIDGLILTHWDRDHSGGVEGLLYRVQADRLYLPVGPEGSGFARDAQVVWVRQEIRLESEGVNITLFPMESSGEAGENSLAVLFQTEKCDTLLTGDISSLYEQILIREHRIPDLEILIAGHHGSKYATSQAILEAAAPDAVVISVGEDNRYGHPAPETLERLLRAGCGVYRTDQAGTILLRR